MPNNKYTFNPADFEIVKQIALTFPGTEESVSHEATPSVKVRGKLLCRLHDSQPFIPIHIGFENRDHYLENYPDCFLLPEHFKNYPYMCMHLYVDDIALIKEVLEVSWRGLASKTMIKQWEASK